MRDKELLEYSCLRIDRLFKDTKVVSSTFYNIEPREHGNYISIDVTLKFTIPEKNIAMLDNHLSDVRRILAELTEVEE